MSTLTARIEPRALDVEVTEEELKVSLTDGRKLQVPLVWFPRLLNATQEQRDKWQLLGGGVGIHWPEVDEDISIYGLLQGIGAPTGSK